MERPKVLNPLTNMLIYKDGKTYQNLLKIYKEDELPIVPSKIKSPRSGKLITVKGPEFKNLIKYNRYTTEGLLGMEGAINKLPLELQNKIISNIPLREGRLLNKAIAQSLNDQLCYTSPILSFESINNLLTQYYIQDWPKVNYKSNKLTKEISFLKSYVIYTLIVPRGIESGDAIGKGNFIISAAMFNDNTLVHLYHIMDNNFHHRTIELKVKEINQPIVKDVYGWSTTLDTYIHKYYGYMSLIQNVQVDLLSQYHLLLLRHCTTSFAKRHIIQLLKDNILVTVNDKLIHLLFVYMWLYTNAIIMQLPSEFKLVSFDFGKQGTIMNPTNEDFENNEDVIVAKQTLLNDIYILYERVLNYLTNL